MSLGNLGPLSTVTMLAMIMLVLAMALAFMRLVRGPSVPDRVVTLDLVSTLAVGIIAVYAMAADRPVFLDAALVLALIGFLGTVAFAYYVAKGASR